MTGQEKLLHLLSQMEVVLPRQVNVYSSSLHQISGKIFILVFHQETETRTSPQNILLDYSVSLHAQTGNLESDDPVIRQNITHIHRGK